jgi:hypothetical protein
MARFPRLNLPHVLKEKEEKQYSEYLIKEDDRD